MESIEYIRSFRVFEYAIIDLILSFWWVYLISWRLSRLFLKYWISIPKMNWLYLTLPIWIIIHILTNSYTPMTMNFLNINDYYILKFIILFSLTMGVYNITLTKKAKV